MDTAAVEAKDSIKGEVAEHRRLFVCRQQDAGMRNLQAAATTNADCVACLHSCHLACTILDMRQLDLIPIHTNQLACLGMLHSCMQHQEPTAPRSPYRTPP